MDFKNNVNGIDLNLDIATAKIARKDFSLETSNKQHKVKNSNTQIIDEVENKNIQEISNSNNYKTQNDNDTKSSIIIDTEISELFIKAKRGEELSQEEIELLSKENPAIRAIAAKVIREEENFKKALSRASSPEDILRLRAQADLSHQEIIKEAEKKNLISEDEGLIINGLV